MDNDKQIVKTPASLFLKEQVFESKDNVNLYNLEDEFEKTKSNKHLFLKVAIGLFVVCLILFAFIFSQFIEQRNKKSDVNITEFEDTNLKELLDSAKKNENKLNHAKSELQDLKNQLNQRIQDINSDSSKKIETILNETIAEEAKKIKIANVRKNERIQIENANIEFNEKISMKNKEVLELQKIVDEYDQRQVNFAKKNEEVLNNQQKLFEIEKSKLVKNYEDKISDLNKRFQNETGKLKTHHNNIVEMMKRNYKKEIDDLILKYNPIITDEEFLNAVKSDSSSDLLDIFDLYVYDAMLNYEGVVTKKQFDALRDQIQKRDLIMERIFQTPYINSIPVALYKSEFYNKKIVKSYEDIWKKFLDNAKEKNIKIENLTDEVKFKQEKIDELDSNVKKIEADVAEKDKVIAKYNSSFESAVKAKNDLGLIIGFSDAKNLEIYISSTASIRGGEFANIIRGANENIGKIVLKNESGRIWGEVFSVQKGKEIMPFDRISIK